MKPSPVVDQLQHIQGMEVSLDGVALRLIQVM